MVGGVLSLLIIIFAFLWSRSILESVMWHAILAGNWTGGTIRDSKAEAGAEDRGNGDRARARA